MTKGQYSSIVDISERDSYLIPNGEVRGIGAPYVQKGSFFDASKPFDPTVLAGSSITMAAIPSPIANKWIHLPDGSVSAPGLAWASETNTGLYKIGSNNIGFSVNSTLVSDWSTARFRLASTYYFYMGATANICSDVGNDYVAISDTLNGGIRITMKNASTGSSAYTAYNVVNNTENGIGVRINGTNLSGSGLHNTAGAAVFSSGVNGGTGTSNAALILVNTFNDNNSPVIFGIKNAESARIAPATSNWLIGTTVDASARIHAFNSGGSQLRLTQASGTRFADFQADSSGNLLITGIVSSGYMRIPNGTFYASQTTGGTAVGLLTLFTDNHVYLGGATGSAFIFRENVTEWFRVQPTTGNAGFLTSTPRRRIDALDTANPQLRLTHTDNSVYAEFQALSTGFLTITPTAGGATIAANNATTATPILALTQASTGDAGIRMSLGSTISYALGIDNSVSGDPWVLSTAASASAALGTGNILSITSGGLATWSRSDAVTTPTEDYIQSSTGDSCVRFAIGSTNSFAVGVDNSDGDKFKVSYAASGSAVLGTNDYFAIDAAGPNVTISGAYLDVTGTTTAIYASYSGAVYTELKTDSSGNFLITPTGLDIDYVKSSVGNAIRLVFLNTDNTNAASSTRMSVQVGGASAGDPNLNFLVTGVTQYTMGIDNDDSDRFKIAASGALGSVDILMGTTTGSVAAGTASLATTATDGFLYVPTCAGTPTGVPTGITGYAPIVIDSTNNKLYFRSGGAWRDAGP